MKNLIIILPIILFLSCGGNHQSTQSKNDSLLTDSLRQKSSKSAKDSIPDGDDQEPSWKEVMGDLLASYNKIERIDTTIIDGVDTMQVHFKYYCLHDSTLIIPKHYLWGGDTSKNFVTHSFASKIIIVNNRDTVLNKTFKRSDFNSVLFDTLQKYATLVEAGFEGYNTRVKDEFLFGYSISIPLTDVGVPAYIEIDKKGNYKILDEYADKYFIK